MRRILIYVLLVAVPTLGLGVGWLGAARREEAGQARERLAAVERAADAVVAATSEGLESLRAAEDERTYDQYNYYWAPPDVIAAQEAVAVSPIARAPRDERIVGWFQVDPGGAVRSPALHPDAPHDVHERGEAVLAALSPEALAACRALAHGAEEEVQVAQAAARVVRRVLPANPVQSQNEWVSQVASEIQQAQAGSAADLDNLAQRGRAARPTRSERTWQDVLAENRGQLELNVARDPSSNGAVPPSQAPAQVYIPDPGNAPSQTPSPAVPSPPEQPRRRVAARVPRPTMPAPAAPGSPDEPPTNVVYTPMAWGLLGDQLALYRVVTSGGASSVQGLLVDREALLNRWLPQIARRRAGAVARIRVVRRGEDATCSVRRALPAPLESAAICLGPLALEPAARGAMALQVSALIGLVLLLGAGSVTLIVAERRAARLAQMQREFVANVSHELRTPLTTLRMHAELLREGWVDEAQRPRFYDDLVVESTRLGQLVDNVLTLSRLERGHVPQPEPGDLAACATEAVEKRRRFLELRGFAVVLDTQPTPARFDREAVDAIVANLLDNAVKYGGGNERTVRMDVAVRGADALLTVSDQGPGIAAPERERVFEPFYRAQAARAGTTGTGLGLALVRRLAREQGGDAWVATTETGCTLVVRLPAC